jgi:hypothetical protein
MLEKQTNTQKKGDVNSLGDSIYQMTIFLLVVKRTTATTTTTTTITITPKVTVGF